MSSVNSIEMRGPSGWSDRAITWVALHGIRSVARQLPRRLSWALPAGELRWPLRLRAASACTRLSRSFPTGPSASSGRSSWETWQLSLQNKQPRAPDPPCCSRSIQSSSSLTHSSCVSQSGSWARANCRTGIAMMTAVNNSTAAIHGLRFRLLVLAFIDAPHDALRFALDVLECVRRWTAGQWLRVGDADLVLKRPWPKSGAR